MKKSKREIAMMGGFATRANHGLEHYNEIGAKGGAATKAKYGHDHFVAIGRKGGAERSRLINLGKQALSECEKK